MNERKTGPKRKREEAEVLKKARKVIPVPEVIATEDPPVTNVDPASQPPRLKKPRKTIRGPDGIKIRPVIVPPTPPPEPIKKFSHKKKNKKTEESASAVPVPVDPPKPEESESPKKKNSKKKKNKKKKKLTEKTPETPDARHGYKALEFLKRWKYERSDWKFEKLRQVWLLTNILNEKELNEENFGILLEYITSVQGRARAQTLKEMQNTMKSIEIKSNSSTDDTVKYERARRIVQMLSDDVSDND